MDSKMQVGRHSSPRDVLHLGPYWMTTFCLDLLSLFPGNRISMPSFPWGKSSGLDLGQVSPPSLPSLQTVNSQGAQPSTSLRGGRRFDG